MGSVRFERMVNFDEQLRAVQKALADYEAGNARNVAIIGQPFSGKTILVDEVISRFGKPVRKVGLTSIVGDLREIFPEDCSEKIIAVDDCQFLFNRRIGGFDMLEKFLDRTVSSDRLFITTWSQFAWNYLKEIFQVNDYFPIVIVLPSLGPAEIEAVISANFDLEGVDFINDAKDRGAIMEVEWKQTGIGGLRFSIPSLRIENLDAMLTNDKHKTRKAIFTEIHALSDGNPGIALALWQRAYHDGVVRSSKVSLPEFDTDIGFDEAFVLSSILMAKSATEDDLRKIAAGRLKVDRILYALMVRGLIREKDKKYSIEPLALHPILKKLKSNRQVW